MSHARPRLRHDVRHAASAFARAAVLGALSFACASVAPPELPTERSSTFGTVRGTSPERVAYVARVLDELAAQVPFVIPGCEPRAVDVRLVGEMSHANWSGATYTVRERRWMELPEGESNTRLSATMAHELVHYQLGPDWSTLPGIVEEGLCDHVAHTLVPEIAPLERAQYAVMLGTALDGSYRFNAERLVGRGRQSTFAPEIMTYTLSAQLDASAMPTFDDALRYDSRDLETLRAKGVRGVLDALGFLLVSRIGPEDLYTLCRRARMQGLAKVPPEWLYESAGLAAENRTGWRSAIDLMLGDAEKRALLRQEGLQFARTP